MSDYTKTTNFTAKDALSTGDPNKLIVGAEFDTEFDAISTAIATKTGKEEAETITAVWNFTGVPTINSTDIRHGNAEYVANGTTSSIAHGSVSDFTITHGLGTDDILVLMHAVGTTSGVTGISWSYRTPDDYHGIGGTSISQGFAASPSTGDVGIRMRNDGGSAQTISYRILVIKRDL
jgi:hypothetical protein